MAKIEAVMEKLTADPAVWSRVQSELSSAENREARFMELAREQGMSVDPEELAALLAKASRELGEDELESVAGGFNPQPEPPLGISAAPRQILIGLLLPAVQKVRA